MKRSKNRGIKCLGEEEEGKKLKRKKFTKKDRAANEVYSQHHIGHGIDKFFNEIQASI